MGIKRCIFEDGDKSSATWKGTESISCNGSWIGGAGFVSAVTIKGSYIK